MQNDTPHRYVFCERMSVKRKAPDGSRLPIERFTSSYDDPAVVAALLRKRGHTLVEFLYGVLQLLGKLYFDADRDTGQCEPTHETIEAFRLEVVQRMERYMAILRPYVPDVSYVVAQRHGFCPKKKGYKMSFRTFVSGIAIHHADCEAFIAALDPQTGFWDMSVYKHTEQLMCAINGKKGGGDNRVLVPLDPSHLDDERILQYVVQHTEPGWFRINIDDTEGADGDDGDAGGDCDKRVVGDGQDSIVRLVRCLGRTTSDNRDEWIRVGMILKGLAGEEDAYYPAWLEFSRISDKFVSDSDCAKTWRSLVAVDATPSPVAGRLTMGTLRYFAKRDDPAAYQAWRAARPVPRERAPPPSWDPCHVVRAAANVVSSDGEVGVDARVEGGDVLFSSDDTEYRVRLSTLGVTSVSGDNPMYIHGAAPGVACGNLVIPNTVAPSQGWNMTRPTKHNVHLKSDGPPRTELLLDMNGDAVIRATVNYPDSNKKVLLRSTKALLAMLDATCREAIRGHLQSQLMVPANVVNNIVFAVNNGTINNYSGGGGDAADSSEFEVVRDALLAHAKDKAHRKAGGLVFEVVEGCPCVFRAIGTIEEYISRVLKGDATFMRHPRRFDELVKFLSNYKDLDELPELRPQRDLLSFANGVLRIDDGAFFPYDVIVDGHPLHGMVARHHIDAPYDPENTATPLLNRVLDAQLDRQVADLLMALLGRLLFPVSAMDRWQVMPYLVGIGGTGKSLILAVVTMLFRKGTVGNLGSKREEVFGMANLVDKEVVIGRDMPAKLSGALSQELMQVMVAGESMEIPRKGLTALNVDWTAPVIMGSNHMPDYVNTGDNVGRRIVTFRFDRVVAQKD